MTKEFRIQISAELEHLLNWCAKYDPQFVNKSTDEIASHFFSKGILSAYEESIKNYTPLAPEIQGKLEQAACDALISVKSDHET